MLDKYHSSLSKFWTGLKFFDLLSMIITITALQYSIAVIDHSHFFNTVCCGFSKSIKFDG